MLNDYINEQNTCVRVMPIQDVALYLRT